MRVSEFRQVLEGYELFIIDLWGVIHDGSEAYPDVLETINCLNKLNKKIVFLSNAPRRAKKTKILLDKIGITDDKYSALLTSGEIAFNYLSTLGKRDGSKKYLFIGPDRDLDVMSQSIHQHVSDPSEADFVISVGYELGEAGDVKDGQLKLARGVNLPMYCFNPDLEIHKHDGSVHCCAGLLAKRYQSLGGSVKLFGKPIAETYEYILDLYPTPKNKILCVGDNMDTDIKGAFDLGLDSALISWGIPAMYMGLKTGDKPSADQVSSFLKKYKVTPTYICPSF